MTNDQFAWIGKEPGIDDWSWVKKLFRELTHIYNKYIDDVAEMPFNYTERSFVASLAMAAYASGCYSLSEYRSKNEEGERRYPDFWITLEPAKNSYDVVFEVKRKDGRISDIEHKYRELLVDGFNDCHPHFSGNLPKIEKAKYQCSLVALQIRCSKNEWDKYNNQASFIQKISSINDSVSRFSVNDIGNGFTAEHVFRYFFWIPFDKIDNPDFKRYYWCGEVSNDEPQYNTPTLGLLVFCLFDTVKQ